MERSLSASSFTTPILPLAAQAKIFIIQSYVSHECPHVSENQPIRNKQIYHRTNSVDHHHHHRCDSFMLLHHHAGAAFPCGHDEATSYMRLFVAADWIDLNPTANVVDVYSRVVINNSFGPGYAMMSLNKHAEPSK